MVKRANGNRVGGRVTRCGVVVLALAAMMAIVGAQVRPAVSAVAKPDAGEAVACLGDVCAGMPDVARDAVKYLRVSEWVSVAGAKPPQGGPQPAVQAAAPGPRFGDWAGAPIRVIGLVPVAPDGSAAFKVPAGRAVFFQVLDENFMEVRRMRGRVAFKAGERRGCVGCHEGSAQAAPAEAAKAAGRDPATPTAPPWGSAAVMDYETMIQPILNRCCVRCHGEKKAKAGVDLSAKRDAAGFAQSYRTMFGIKPGQNVPVASDAEGREWYERVLKGFAPGQLVSVAGPLPAGGGPSHPRQFGSPQSQLILSLRAPEHKKRVTLERDEWLTLVTWVDANAPYAGAAEPRP